MSAIHIKRSDLVSKKGRIVSPLFRTDSLPNNQIERLNTRLSDILAQTKNTIPTGDNDNANTH